MPINRSATLEKRAELSTPEKKEHFRNVTGQRPIRPRETEEGVFLNLSYLTKILRVPNGSPMITRQNVSAQLVLDLKRINTRRLGRINLSFSSYGE